MGQPVDNTFVLPIGCSFLVYSPLNGISAVINKTGVIELKKQLHLMQLNQAESGSALYDLAYKICTNTLLNINCKTGGLNPEFLGIIPTRACNGACNYCDFNEGKTSTEVMSLKMAAGITNWYFDLSDKLQREIVAIHFFGGEPMVASEVIEVVVHKARMMASENKIITSFEITTNGQYAETKARFLGQYFNRVILSLDGTAEVQNQHRPLKNGKESFDNAVKTARIISHSQAELCLRACVSSLNVDFMEQITRWFCETFNPSVINFEGLCSTTYSRAMKIFPPNPYKFAENFIKAREVGKDYGIEVIYSSDVGSQPTVSSCPVGKDTVIFSPDGLISSCYFMPQRWRDVGLEFSLGTINDDGIVKIDQSIVNAIRDVVLDKTRCSKCFCQWNCAGGCHVGNTFPGSSTDYNDFCQQTRIISVSSMLSDLGLHNMTIDLLQDNRTMKKLAMNRSDLLNDFNCG